MSVGKWDKIFFRRKKVHSEGEECTGSKRLEDFERQIGLLLHSDRFIARSDYRPIHERYAELHVSLSNLEKMGMLDVYCEKNRIDPKKMERFLCLYEDLGSKEGSKVVEAHNDEFVKRHLAKDKLYLDTILRRVDPNVKLDEEQRRVVLSDEDYTLVVAGAGAGKTTTMAAKVKYLVEKRGVKPEQILVISYTNKAVGELRSKINKGLKIDCPVTTFHKTGYAILRKKDTERKTVVDGGFMWHVVNNYLKENILECPELVDKLILFFGSYFDAPYEGDNLNDFFNYISKADFSTLRGNMDEYAEKIIDQRTGKCVSIAHETLRSVQEVRIANFLFMNGIDYVYEKIYPYNMRYSYKPYTPDFTITQGDKTVYIEHFGITEDGRNSRYTEEQLARYKKEIDDKIRLHRRHHTDLVYTYSEYDDGRDYLDHLQEMLVAQGIEFRPRTSREVFDKLVSTEENKYIIKLVKLVCTFLHGFKTNGFTIEHFHQFQSKSSNERNKLFLSICERCYLEYSKRLKEKQAVDFEDMINSSAKMLREKEIQGERLGFKYIIVDEYQDISRQRFNLTLELSKLCDAKIVAVGDDWQSIYAYAGSDITLFTQFKESFGYGLELGITKTYRNAQEVIDIAGGFIQKNTAQIRKSLVSPKHITRPVVVETYTENVDRSKYAGKGGKYFLVGETVERIVGQILEENPDASILLLGRYGFDAFNLCRSSEFTYEEKTGNVISKKYPFAKLDFMTVHRAKGLGYDHVILINARNELYGFPSQVQDDPVLKYVVRDDHSMEYAEERRLFYVALTRTKNRVYIVVPQQHPSDFVRELVKDYPGVTVNGELDDCRETRTEMKRCPVCGYPMQLRYKKAYGLKLWICSNEPEICDFMTNNLKGGDLPILKCDCCKDGYLIVKEGWGEPFLGCTNYRADRSGCNRAISRDKYLRSVKPFFDE